MKKLYTKIFGKFMAILVLVVLLTDSAFLLYFTRTIVYDAQETLNAATNYCSNVMDKVIEETRLINSLVQRNSEIQTALRTVPQDMNTRYAQRLAINGYLYTLQKNNTSYVDSFYVLLDDGRQFKSTNFPLLYNNTQDIPEYSSLRESEEEDWLFTYNKSLVVNNYKSGYVAVTYPLVDVRSGKNKGIILEEIQTKFLGTELLAACHIENGRVEVCSEENKVLFEMGNIENTRFGWIESEAGLENSWKVRVFCSRWGLVGKTMKLSILIGVGLACAVIVLAFFLSRRIAENISDPILRLLHAMENEELEHHPNELQIETDIFEVACLLQEYNQMRQRLWDVFLELEEKQKQLRKSEFAALQAQINPHFLYNTLDNITWHIYAGDKQTAIDEVRNLSRFFRLSLSRGASMVSIKDEIEHVDIYLQIQKKRYGKRFDFEIKSYMRTDDMEQFYIPKLILQPLAENSIYHGFEEITEGGKIYISVDCKQNQIIFTVWDNGKGIEEEKQTEIQKALYVAHTLETVKGKKGYGIFNINARLKNVFGMEYGLQLMSEKGKYTEVQIVLPRKKQLDLQENSEYE